MQKYPEKGAKIAIPWVRVEIYKDFNKENYLVIRLERFQDSTALL